MKTVIRAIVGLMVAFVVVLVAGAYLIPAETVVQRQIIIKAAPEKVFTVVGNLKRFNDWSPWADLDPNAKYVFEGAESGNGQKMSWESANPNVGRGSQTVVEFIDNSKVVTELDFGSMGKAQASLSLAAVDGGTGVTWGFRTEASGVLDRWMSLMFDRWIGADYEKGLGRLKELVEKENAGG